MSTTPPRQRLLSSRKFDIDRLTVIGRSGQERVVDVVVHPGAVVVLPVDDTGRFVLIRNRRAAIDRELWELTAGTLEVGEDPGDCAGRELIEETGFRADTLEPLCGFYSAPGFCTEYLHVFLARGLTAVGQALEDTEEIQVETLEPDAAYQMVADGQIQDAKTVAALLYYRAFVAPSGGA